MKKYLFILPLLFNFFLSHAHEGHIHDVRPVEVNENPAQKIEKYSDRYEVLIKAGEILPGEENHLELFISDFTTNLPVEADGLILIVKETGDTLKYEHHEKGIYHFIVKFNEEGNYSFRILFNANRGAELMEFGILKIGKLQVETLVHKKESSYTSFVFIVVAFIIGFFLALIFFRKKPVAATTIVLFFLIPLSPNLSAHGDDHHGNGTTTEFSTMFDVPKESQFLFGIETQEVKFGDFNHSISLYGTILPSSNGQAKLTAPHNAIVSNVLVKVGEEVKSGQTIAVIDVLPDASTKIDWISKANQLEAEYSAAKKEWDRLQRVKDIASKKDIDESESRLQQAERNLELFNSGKGRSLPIISPVDGTVEAFHISKGTQVLETQEMFTITSLKNVYVEVQVFDQDIKKVIEANSFAVVCSDNVHRNTSVKLLTVSPSMNAGNQSQKILLEMENNRSEFRIGEFVNVTAFSESGARIKSVPNSAISELNGKPIVFMKNSAEEYSISYVVTGVNNGLYTEIKKGISEGDRVVINGAYQMKMIYLNQ